MTKATPHNAKAEINSDVSIHTLVVPRKCATTFSSNGRSENGMQSNARNKRGLAVVQTETAQHHKQKHNDSHRNTIAEGQRREP